jgi:putative tryptophan/tyrosine transport system substrate-binding protein
MRRREFIALVGGAAAVSPLAGRAQQLALPVIGFIDAGSAAQRSMQVAAFRKGLAETGYEEGRTVAFELRWAEGEYGRFGELATDLVRRRVSVIVTLSSATAALAAKPLRTRFRSCPGAPTSNFKDLGRFFWLRTKCWLGWGNARGNIGQDSAPH